MNTGYCGLQSEAVPMDIASETGPDSLRHGMLGINVTTPAYYI